MALMRVWAEGARVVFESGGFRLEVEPRLAIGGELREPVEVRRAGGRFEVALAGGRRGYVEVGRVGGVLTVTCEAEGGSSESGHLVELACAATGFERCLLVLFTRPYEWRRGVEPCEYPSFPEVDELSYSAWCHPVHLREGARLPRHSKALMALLKSGDSYVVVLPLPDGGARGMLTGFSEVGRFSVVLDALCSSSWQRVTPLVLGVGSDPYALVSAAFEAGVAALGRPSVLRARKRFPEPLDYLGWCSWNAFWRNVSEERVLWAANRFRELGLPIKMFLVDDGWMDEEDAAIKGFEANPRKFPRGLVGLVAELRRRGIKFVGLWHTMNGYWRGFHPDGEAAKELDGLLMRDSEGRLAPLPSEAFKLFSRWYEFLSRAGFDFVKVDNQSFVASSYRGLVRIGEAAAQLHAGLEGAAHVNSLEVLNCMAQQPENCFSWLRSSVSRNCDDYVVPHSRSRDKLHIYFNAYNALWMSQLVWPDWDMFQTHDPYGALQQAVARAVSGGPVYITDEPDKVRADIVKKLAFSDGHLPRPDRPAVPTEDCLMRDPYNEPVPLKVFSHVCVDGLGTCGVVAAFNITKDDVEVRGSVSPRDARLPSGTYAVVEYFSREWAKLDSGGELAFEVEPMGVKLFLMVPAAGWLTPIGLWDVFVAVRGLDRVALFEDEAVVWLRQPGTLLALSEASAVVDGVGEVEEGLVAVKAVGRVVRFRPKR